VKTYRDMAAGGVVVCFAVLLFAASFSVRDFTASSIGADFLPRLMAVILVALGLVLVYENLRANAAVAPGRGGADSGKPFPVSGSLLVVVNILLFCLYLFFLEDIGFLICTALYLFAQMWLLTAPVRRRPLLFAVVSVFTSAVSYYLFVLVFQVILPAGILG
jgi:hypothetical protein